MINKPEIAVLMSTYNGNKYIQEQIDSILNQTYEGKIIIYIRDDGSKDNTREIIKQIEKDNESSLREIFLWECENVGVQKSFLDIIQRVATHDIYFFADQDDVWKSDKVQRAVDVLEKCQDERKIYCSDYSITDSDLNVLFDKQVELNDNTFKPLYLQFFNEFPGCVMAFNNGVMKILRDMKLDTCMMHDSVAMMVGSAVGTVCYDEVPTILHRIHGNNVVGYGHKKVRVFKWIKEKMKLLFGKENYDVSETGKRLMDVAEQFIKPQFKEDIILLGDYKETIKKTFRLLKHKDIKRSIDRTTLSIKCKILFHIF